MRPEIPEPYLENTPQNYYKLAWAERLKFVRALIDVGEDNPYRIIKLLERHENRHDLGMVSQAASFRDENGNVVEELEVFTGQADWLPIDPGPADSLIPTGVAAVTDNSFHGEALTLPAYTDIKGIVAGWIIDLVDDNCDAIVELGAGFGRNLFNVHLGGGPRGIPYFSGEYAESGRELAELLAALDPQLDLRAVAFDHSDADFEFLAGFEQPLVFTCHSIEQVHMLPADYFAKLAAAAPRVTCIHFEPFGFQIDTDNPFSKQQREMFTDRKWNQNFVPLLQQAANDGTIQVSHIYKDMIPNEAPSPTSVALWRNF